jgi:hypothetical protein
MFLDSYLKIIIIARKKRKSGCFARKKYWNRTDVKNSLANEIGAKKKETNPSAGIVASRLAASEKYKNWFSALP